MNDCLKEHMCAVFPITLLLHTLTRRSPGGRGQVCRYVLRTDHGGDHREKEPQWVGRGAEGGNIRLREWGALGPLGGGRGTGKGGEEGGSDPPQTAELIPSQALYRLRSEDHGLVPHSQSQ